MSVVYVAEAIASGDGRNGHVESSDGRVRIDFAKPREIGGTGAGSNPEQLVAMGYAACFLSSIHILATRQNIEISNPEIICRAILSVSDSISSISFEIAACLPGLEQSIAESLTAGAHKHCVYSRAFTKGVEVNLQTTTFYIAAKDSINRLV
jgi:osmotically inducible protein OsmC